MRPGVFLARDGTLIALQLHKDYCRSRVSGMARQQAS